MKHFVLQQNLEAAKTSTRDAINRSLRHKNMTSLAKGYLIGPTSYRWVQTKERLDRPLVRVYQGHLGKEVPESRHLIKVNIILLLFSFTYLRNINV